MHISITLSIALLMACLCAANADDLTVERQFLQQSGMQEDTRTSIRNDELTALREQNAMLKAQNQALREFQDGIFATLWSVIAMVVVFIGLLTYFQSRISDREAQSIKEEAIKPLRQIAIEYGKFFLISLQLHGRLGTPGLDKIEIRKNVEKCLRGIGLTESEIEAVIEVEYPWICLDYYKYVTRRVDNILNNKSPDIWSNFKDSHNTLDSIPIPSELRSFVSELGIHDTDVEGILEDYEHYCENKTHRRPQKWKTRYK